jgi:hypothetical protein
MDSNKKFDRVCIYRLPLGGWVVADLPRSNCEMPMEHAAFTKQEQLLAWLAANLTEDGAKQSWGDMTE